MNRTVKPLAGLCLAALSSLSFSANAAVYDLTFYANSNSGNPYTHISGFSPVFHGHLEIADSALVSNGFVAFGSADFLDFDITIESGGIGFNFKLGEDIFHYNRPNQSEPRDLYGVRLDVHGQPVRFDSPNTSYSTEWVTDTANYGGLVGNPPFLSLTADDSFPYVMLSDGTIKPSYLVTPAEVVMTPFAGYWGFDNATGPNVPDYSYGLWTITAAPVPEPETYALMLAGLGLVGFAARRRKH